MLDRLLFDANVSILIVNKLFRPNIRILGDSNDFDLVYFFRP